MRCRNMLQGKRNTVAAHLEAKIRRHWNEKRLRRSRFHRRSRKNGADMLEARTRSPGKNAAQKRQQNNFTVLLEINVLMK